MPSPMQKNSWSFAVPLLPASVAVTRWGHYGTPLLLFASAGGDSLEPERLGLIEALAPLIEAGRLKAYAVDGTAMRILVAGNATAPERVQAQRAFDDWVASSLVPLVRRDCQSDSLEPLACGCALGAASALKALLHSPQLFRGCIGLSGTYDLLPWIAPAAAPPEFSPLQWLAQLPEGVGLGRLRQRSVTLACTEGAYDDAGATAGMAAVLNARGIPTHTEVWGPDQNFGFSSWRQMLPRFVGAWL
jgi:esterase/lipase superfamily enzyme